MMISYSTHAYLITIGYKMTRTGLIHSRIPTTATSTTKFNNSNNIHLINNSNGSISSRSSNFPFIYRNDYTLKDHDDEIHKIDESIVLKLPLKWKFWTDDSSVSQLPLSLVNNSNDNNHNNNNNNNSSSSRSIDNDSLQMQFNYVMSKMKDKYENKHKAVINDPAASSSLLCVSHKQSYFFNSMQSTAPISASSSDLILLNLEDMELLNQIKTKISNNGINMLLNADDHSTIEKVGNHNNSHDSITKKSNTHYTTTTINNNNNTNNNNTHYDDDDEMKSINETKQPEHIDFAIDDYYEDKPVFYSSITRNDEERALLKSRLLKFQQYKNNNNSNNGVEISNSTNVSSNTNNNNNNNNNNNPTATTFSLNPLLHSFQAAANPLHRVKSERGLTPTKRRQINDIKHLSESKVPVSTSSSSSSSLSIQASSSSSVIINNEDDETLKDELKSNKLLKYQETKRPSIQLSSLSLNQQSNNDDFDNRQ